MHIVIKASAKSYAAGNKINMQVARQAALTNKNLERLIRGLLHLEIATKKGLGQPTKSAQGDLDQMASRAHTRRSISTGLGMATGFELMLLDFALGECLSNGVIMVSIVIVHGIDG